MKAHHALPSRALSPHSSRTFRLHQVVRSPFSIDASGVSLLMFGRLSQVPLLRAAAQPSRSFEIRVWPLPQHPHFIRPAKLSENEFDAAPDEGDAERSDASDHCTLHSVLADVDATRAFKPCSAGQGAEALRSLRRGAWTSTIKWR
jgi:hypothetical protein